MQMIFRISVWSLYGIFAGSTTPVRVKLWVMEMKGYSAFLRSPELEPQHQMKFIVMWGHFFDDFTPPKGKQAAYSTLSRYSISKNYLHAEIIQNAFLPYLIWDHNWWTDFDIKQHNKDWHSIKNNPLTYNVTMTRLLLWLIRLKSLY